jgi:hypothetical protein
MSKQKVLFTSLLFFSFSFVCAQQNIIGKLRDTLGMPIANASVLLKYSLNNNPQTKFTLANADGTYKLIVIAGAQNPTLQCIALGYQSQTITINTTQNNYNFVLKPSATLLKPVNITAKQPVKQKNDTTTFLVDAYSKKNEQTVEDLIKRLPGMDVDKEGNIRYNGKSIERVLIEGDDLFERDFKMLTKNLSADMVEKIQAIDNYNDNPLLAGLGKTDKQILNLQLKKDRLLNINGNVNLNAGLPLTNFDRKLNLISITPNLKGILLGAANNIGTNPFTILGIAPPNIQQRFNLEDNILAQTNPSLVNVPYLYYNGIDLNRNNFNNAKIGSANFIFKPTKKTELKLMAYWVADNNRQEQHKNTLFTIHDLPTIISDETNRLTKKQFYQAYTLTLTSRPNKNEQIKYVGKLGYTSVEQKAVSTLISGDLQQNLDEKSNSTQQRIEYTNRLGKETALDIELLYNFSQNPQNLIIASPNYHEFFPSNSTDKEIVYQDTDIPLNQFSVNTRLIGKLYNQIITFNTGYNYIKRNFNTHLYTLANQDPNTINGFGGNYNNLVQNIYIDGAYDWEFNKNLSLTLNSTYTIEQYSLKNKLENSDIINESYNYLQNKFTLKYKTEKSGTINFQYSNNLNLPILSDILPVYWLSDFKTFSKGAGAFIKRNGNTFSFNYSIADYYSTRLLAYTGFIYSTKSNNYINNLLFTPSYQINSKAISNNNYPNYVAYARLEKYVDYLKGNFIIDLNSFWVKLVGISNNIKNTTDINSTTLKTGYKSGFKGWFSFDLNTTLRLNRQSVLVKEKYYSNTKNFENRLALYLILNDNFNIEFDAEQYILAVNKAYKSLMFLDIKARYQLKKKDWSFNFSALNILNNKSLSFNSISQNQFSTQTYNIVPHIFMLGAYHRFTL